MLLSSPFGDLFSDDEVFLSVKLCFVIALSSSSCFLPSSLELSHHHQEHLPIPLSGHHHRPAPLVHLQHPHDRQEPHQQQRPQQRAHHHHRRSQWVAKPHVRHSLAALDTLSYKCQGFPRNVPFFMRTYVERVWIAKWTGHEAIDEVQMCPQMSPPYLWTLVDMDILSVRRQ